eukprot:GHVP01050152.1.p1 GENE.GHVP01050152.1~~GHVP01050152.1.p1  ORF type:complete len:258 (-),score=17.47 GHVP01050152.1:602-1375(-)
MISMGVSFNRVGRLDKRLKDILICISIGVVYYIFAPAHTEYGEYGKHFNFFYIISAVKTLTGLYSYLPSYKNIVGPFLLGFLCIFSKIVDIESYAFDERRRNLFEQNKEGIISILGCFVLFSLGVRIRMILSEKKRILVREIIMISTVSFIFYIVGMKPSRRLVNHVYCSQIYLISLIHFLLLEIQKDYIVYSSFFKAVSDKKFIFFILSDLLTGLCNKLMSLPFVGSKEGLLLIYIYLSVPCIFIYFVNYNNKIFY